MATFEVVAMVLAPERHIAAFTAHYRRRGADRIRIFFDGPEAPKGDFHGAEVVLCNDDFWTARGVTRPHGVEDRQRVIYNHAYGTARADWLLVVDVDEFILGDEEIGALLERIEPSRESVIFGSVEATYSHRDDMTGEYGASFFRKPYGRPFCSVLPHLVTPGVGGCFTKGLLGHFMGKHAVRTGITDIKVDIHESKRDGQPLDALIIGPGVTPRPLYLAHYDAISFQQWRDKWDRRVAKRDVLEVGRKRNLQFDLFAAARQRGAELDLFKKLYAVNGLQLFVLRCFNLIIPHKPNDLIV